MDVMQFGIVPDRRINDEIFSYTSPKRVLKEENELYFTSDDLKRPLTCYLEVVWLVIQCSRNSVKEYVYKVISLQ